MILCGSNVLGETRQNLPLVFVNEVDLLWTGMKLKKTNDTVLLMYKYLVVCTLMLFLSTTERQRYSSSQVKMLWTHEYRCR